jgi:very-short-patch-repair endonuclease
MLTKLMRAEDGTLQSVGLADGQPISHKKQSTMKGVSRRRKNVTTPAEKRMVFALRVMCWKLGGIVKYQREKTVHIADMLSRSLDFYFNQGRLGIEIDGDSHSGELQKAKDQWTDELIEQHGHVKILRFSNAQVFSAVHEVIFAIAEELRDRHSWPIKFRRRFDIVRSHASDAEHWYALGGEYWKYERERRTK